MWKKEGLPKPAGVPWPPGTCPSLPSRPGGTSCSSAPPTNGETIEAVFGSAATTCFGEVCGGAITTGGFAGDLGLVIVIFEGEGGLASPRTMHSSGPGWTRV